MVLLRQFVDLLGQVHDGILVLNSFARDDEPMDLLGESSEVGEEMQVRLDGGDVILGEGLEDVSLLLLVVSTGEFLHDVEDGFVTEGSLVAVVVFACAESSLHLVDSHCRQILLGEEFHVSQHAHVAFLESGPVVSISGRDLLVSVVSHLPLVFLAFSEMRHLIFTLSFLDLELFACLSSLSFEFMESCFERANDVAKISTDGTTATATTSGCVFPDVMAFFFVVFSQFLVLVDLVFKGFYDRCDGVVGSVKVLKLH